VRKAIETYDPSVKFEPVRLVGTSTVRDIRSLKAGRKTIKMVVTKREMRTK
jgi:hypothetical protein